MNKIQKKGYPDNILEVLGIEEKLNKDQLNGLEEAISRLSEREQDFLNLRFKKDLTFKKISEMKKISLSRPSQIINKSIRRIKNPKYISYIKYGKKGYTKILNEIEKRRIEKIDNKSDELKLLETPIAHLNLSTRTYLSLARVGAKTINDILSLISREYWYLYIRNLGAKSAKEVVDLMFELKVIDKNHLSYKEFYDMEK